MTEFQGAVFGMPPAIIHSSIARCTEPIEAFRLVRTTREPLLAFERLKTMSSVSHPFGRSKEVPLLTTT
ncbi:MAG: hypothetical protein JWN38_23 [Candidatus Saccharibacteria bacterium]|nr:hypothetical protein [Candidatus Saccharibacteria bacterium]